MVHKFLPNYRKEFDYENTLPCPIKQALKVMLYATDASVPVGFSYLKLQVILLGVYFLDRLYSKVSC